eukprot:2157313-Pleurochrysis_carterae.AAC.4
MHARFVSERIWGASFSLHAVPQAAAEWSNRPVSNGSIRTLVPTHCPCCAESAHPHRSVPLIERVSRSLLQLVLCFVGSLVRSEPYTGAPLVALYSLREQDARAMLLYLLLTCLGALLDIVDCLAGRGAIATLLVVVELVLKLAALYPAATLYEKLPAERLKPIERREMQAIMQQVVRQVVTDTLEPHLKEATPTQGVHACGGHARGAHACNEPQRMHAAAPKPALASGTDAPSSGSTADEVWEQV